MGFISQILKFSGRKVTIDPGGGNLITSEDYRPAGDDSQPLVTDYALNVHVVRTGNACTVGYTDLKNSPKAAAGDKRLYARDSSSGTEVAEIWIKNSGDIDISNSAGEIKLSNGGEIDITNSIGHIKLLSNGNIDANGVIITPAGTLTATTIDATNLTINGLSFAAHVHSGVQSGPSNTGGPQ